MIRNPVSTAEFFSQGTAQPRLAVAQVSGTPTPAWPLPCKVLQGRVSGDTQGCAPGSPRPCLRPAHLPTKRRERGRARHFPPIQVLFKDHKGGKVLQKRC